MKVSAFDGRVVYAMLGRQVGQSMHRWKSMAQALDLCTACKTSAHRTCVSTKKHIVHFYDYLLMYVSCVTITDILYTHVCV